MNHFFDRFRVVNRSQATITRLKYRAQDDAGASLLVFDQPVRIRDGGFRDVMNKQLKQPYVHRMAVDLTLDNGFVVSAATKVTPPSTAEPAGEIIGADFALDDGPTGYSLNWRLIVAYSSGKPGFEDGGV